MGGAVELADETPADQLAQGGSIGRCGVYACVCICACMVCLHVGSARRALSQSSKLCGPVTLAMAASGATGA